MTTLRHGMARRGENRAKVYNVWASMHRRCNNQSQQNYPLYGGRSIKVCERWKRFENFYADMGDPPAGYSIDRIDSNGDYEPGNCRWATAKEQRKNQRPMEFTPAKRTALEKAWKALQDNPSRRGNGLWKLTAEERSALGRRAAAARWSKQGAVVSEV